jgi:hypothetical protein
MTDESINRILRRLNTSKAPEIIRRQIGENVWWGFAWGTQPRGYMRAGIQEQGEEFFFIKAPDGKFAAAVLRMGACEFHWYTVPAYRRRGLLIEPLKQVILPFIFAFNEHEFQRGTLDPRRPHASASTKVAQRVGFKHTEDKNGEHIYEVRRENVGSYTAFPFPAARPEDLQALKQRVNEATRYLRMLFDETRIGFANRIAAERIGDVEHQITNAQLDLLDIIDIAYWSVKRENEWDESR